MYFVLYDKDLRSIGQTYLLESWSRIKRATDFDEMKMVGEQIPYSADPFLVVINDRQGKQLFSGLASTPIVDDKSKKTSISLKDYFTLLNSDIVMTWNAFYSDLSQYLDHVLSTWREQISVGLPKIEWDVSRLKGIPLKEWFSSTQGSKENVSAYSLILDAILFYDLYYESSLDLHSKTLTFIFKESLLNTVSVRLSDFGFPKLEKSFGDFNRASVYNYKYDKIQEWALTEDNSVVKLPSSKKLVYPAKNKNFIAEYPSEDLTESQSVNDAVYEAVTALSGNRFQENIDLDVNSYKSLVDLSSIDFSYSVDVYTDQGFYRRIPVGEIETDSGGTHIVRLGHRVQELTQEI